MVGAKHQEEREAFVPLTHVAMESDASPKKIDREIGVLDREEVAGIDENGPPFGRAIDRGEPCESRAFVTLGKALVDHMRVQVEIRTMLDEPQAVLRELSVSTAVQLKSPVVHEELGAGFDVIRFENNAALQGLDNRVIKRRGAKAGLDPCFQVLHPLSLPSDRRPQQRNPHTSTASSDGG
ncbi:MAG: hypothetical protein ACKV2T_04485 [Kofleriaceae bacterium]